MNIAGINDDEQDDQFYDRRRPTIGLNIAAPDGGGGRNIDFSGMTSDDEEDPASRSGSDASGKPIDMGSAFPGAGEIADTNAGAPSMNKQTQAEFENSGGFVGNNENPLATRSGRINVSMAGPNAAPNDSQLAIDQKKLADLKAAGSPISRIHNPFLRTLAHIGDTAGTMFLPGYADLPFTDLKHKSNIRGAEHAVAEDLGEQKEQAQTEQEKAKAIQERAKAQESLNPQEKTIEHVMTPSGAVVALTKDPTTGEPTAKVVYQGDPKVESEVRTLQVNGEAHDVLVNKRDGTTIKDLGVVGVKPPSTEKSPADQLKKRIADAFEKGDHATVKKLQDELKAIDPEGAQRIAIQLGNQDISRTKLTDAQQAQLDKQSKPYQDVLDSAENAHYYADLNTAPADAALLLRYIDAIKPEKGFRLTGTELKMFQGTRSYLGDLQALTQKLDTGQMLTPDQKQKMLQVIDVAAKAAQNKIDDLNRKHGGAGGETGGGGEKTISEAQVRQAAKDHGISFEKAKEDAESKGYQVTK